jgi:predicted amidophosphoribosyltransferase
MPTHDKGPLVCLDCGAQFPRRIGTSGRQPERCPPCKGEDVRRQSRENARARRARAAPRCYGCHGPLHGGGVRVCRGCASRIQHAPEDCQGCGTPQDDARGGLCAECSARD